MQSALEQWLSLAPGPWELRADQKWHTYLSYRTMHRQWVLQLYDVLKTLGYSVFLDQYVLTAGTQVVKALDEGIRESASAILVWGARSEDSEWIKREFQTFIRLRHEQEEFSFVLALLDNAHLPPFAASSVYVDFSDFREGPSGTPLLQLLYGLHRQPLPSSAIELAARVDAETKQATAQIRAARSVGDADELIKLAASDSLAWHTSPGLLCQVIDGLVSLRQYDRAVEISSKCREEFPRALRPQQLHALALARRGDWQAAQRLLTELYESGERDAETLGILARTWMDRYNADKEESFLRRSRDLYREAFQAAPSDFYSGINAASKTAMLGELEEAARLAARVEDIVGAEPTFGDYWKTATTAEVKLLQRDFEAASQLYRAAIGQDPLATGSHESTYQQAAMLLDHLKASPDERAHVLSAFQGVRPQAGSGRTRQPQATERALAAKVLFGLVALRRAEPGLMNSLDARAFWEAVRKMRPRATYSDLPEIAAELEKSMAGQASPLWLAWVEAVKSADLDKILV